MKYSSSIYSNLCIPVLLSWLVSGCIQPPDPIEASVVPQQEVELITQLQNGRYYLNSGRADLAEEYFRKALQLSPQQAGIHNDLGLALLKQNRPLEAIRSFQAALSYDDQQLIYKINLVLAYYNNENYDQAITIIDSILYPDQLARVNTADYLRRQLTPEQSVLLYRTLSSIYYNRGDLEHAICYSNMAAETAHNKTEAGIHIRLLLHNERINDAQQFIRRYLDKEKDKVIPPRIMQDYAVTLLVKGERPLAAEASRRVLGDLTTAESDRRTAYLILLSDPEISLASKQQLSAELLQYSPLFCTDESLRRESYWPWKFSQLVKSTSQEVCNDE